MVDTACFHFVHSLPASCLNNNLTLFTDTNTDFLSKVRWIRSKILQIASVSRCPQCSWNRCYASALRRPWSHVQIKNIFISRPRHLYHMVESTPSCALLTYFDHSYPASIIHASNGLLCNARHPMYFASASTTCLDMPWYHHMPLWWWRDSAVPVDLSSLLKPL